MTKEFRKNVHLTFPPTISGSPVICDLTRMFDLSFNILKAQITPRKEGYMTVEIIGSRENYQKGIDYLEKNHVVATPVAQRISRDEDSCMHCGMCTAICPNGSLFVNREKRIVEFDIERCTACGMCVRVCPVNAMHVDAENGMI
ncbi:NIL domain-containing protein [Halodesulfovibrio aestuarii]|uniref:NIL domain-containing protein n=1 Tax=Halodesulfovibrio aestuarii TaxID=126333 RepID=A0A8G2F836_9BACT|nr:NIL domain-containing protein [Halodesulfovibrio aestuarii]SHI65297.1 NIL domain-containing protein [Halodesulfovibrio aestuarii]